MTRDQAIDKVRALLKLAESTNHPEEAKTARAIAAKLSTEHDISEGDLNELSSSQASMPGDARRVSIEDIIGRDLFQLLAQFMFYDMNFVVIGEDDGNNTTKNERS